MGNSCSSTNQSRSCTLADGHPETNFVDNMRRAAGAAALIAVASVAAAEDRYYMEPIARGISATFSST